MLGCKSEQKGWRGSYERGRVLPWEVLHDRGEVFGIYNSDCIWLPQQKSKLVVFWKTWTCKFYFKFYLYVILSELIFIYTRKLSFFPFPLLLHKSAVLSSLITYNNKKKCKKNLEKIIKLLHLHCYLHIITNLEICVVLYVFSLKVLWLFDRGDIMFVLNFLSHWQCINFHR